MSKVAVIDLDSIIYVSGHPNKKLDEFGNPIKEDNKFVYIEKNAQELIDSARSLMQSILIKSGATHYIAFVKGRNTTKFRLAINSEYKQNRKDLKYPVWLGFLKQYYITEWNAVEVNDMEVDDMCKITYLNTPNSYIVAIDKDLLSLEGKHYNWRKDEWITNTKEQEDNYFWTSMITGDTIDNIKGIEGKGKVFANKLLVDSKCPPARVLKAYIEKYGEYEGIQNYYKNYMCLKILEKSNAFVTPSAIEFNLNVEKGDNKEVF